MPNHFRLILRRAHAVARARLEEWAARTALMVRDASPKSQPTWVLLTFIAVAPLVSDRLAQVHSFASFRGDF
jgi:hypothetical protein